MKLCILENDDLDPVIAPTYIGYGVMFDRLLRHAGATGQFDIFNTFHGQYPDSFDDFDAVLLTGSHADSFSEEPWIRKLRHTVLQLLQTPKKIIGVCFGHQLVALCLGARVGRAGQGWGVGRLQYQWLAPDMAPGRTQIALLASHQDQVFDLPVGARRLATSDFCPVAAFALQDRVLCVQAHPEFVEDYSAFLLNKRRAVLDEALYTLSMHSLALGHEGDAMARIIVSFINAPKQV
jgi:GMP synthase-like glutamine amidotransferase